MTTRQALHDLIDRLPDDLLDDAELRLTQLKRPGDEALDRVLAAAPPEDESLSAGESGALARWGAGERDGQPLTRDEVEALIADRTS